ncbi:hypothetical protein [Streptomyces sp. NBC_01373]|uniref:hypothetical protein n=1 Tax=Streptomyces sp. NBC_01373 TaxID=2903843 RepID=UPI00225780E5|nr:hypothetical protein [Streptomyces sp. NBC_01373]MCX4707159.1 hypothetical protein [Streptomyces sp. NBC_01373]
MTTDARPDPDDDRFGYSRQALARLVLSHRLQELSERAMTWIPTTHDMWAHPGEAVSDLVDLVELAQDALSAAVVYERQKGTSWAAMGEALGEISRQSAHERYSQAVEDWQLALVEPFEPAAEGARVRSRRLHEAAYEPTATGRRLDAWAREHVERVRDDAHPVTGHLPGLSTAEEMVQVLDAVHHAQQSQAGPAERARLQERKAALLERIAAEDDRPEVAEQAAEARARAAQLRAGAEGGTQ